MPPPDTSAIARMPSHFISNAQSSMSSMVSTDPGDASMGDGSLDSRRRSPPICLRPVERSSVLPFAAGRLYSVALPAGPYSCTVVSCMRWMSQLFCASPPRPPVWMSAYLWVPCCSPCSTAITSLPSRHFSSS